MQIDYDLELGKLLETMSCDELNTFGLFREDMTHDYGITTGVINKAFVDISRHPDAANKDISVRIRMLGNFCERRSTSNNQTYLKRQNSSMMGHDIFEKDYVDMINKAVASQLDNDYSPYDCLPEESDDYCPPVQYKITSLSM